MATQPPTKRRRLTDGKESKTAAKGTGVLGRLVAIGALYPMFLGYLDLQEWLRLRCVGRIFKAADPNPNRNSSFIRFKQWHQAIERILISAKATSHENFTIDKSQFDGHPVRILQNSVATGVRCRNFLGTLHLPLRASTAFRTTALHPCTDCSRRKAADTKNILRIVVPLVPFPRNELDQATFCLTSSWLCFECCVRPTNRTCCEHEAQRLGNQTIVSKAKYTWVYGQKRFLVRDVRRPKKGTELPSWFVSFA